MTIEGKKKKKKKKKGKKEKRREAYASKHGKVPFR
jgi:hypothetical protein